MKKRIREKELRKLSFVDSVPDETRIISPFISYSEEKRKFVVYVPDRKGGLVEFLDGIDAVLIEGAYWSKKIVNSETDLFNECLHILYNNFSFLEKVRKFGGILNDIQNFGAVIHKQIILFNYAQKFQIDNTSIKRIYITEVEYLMGLVRSFYALMYGVFKWLFERKTLINLPDSLGKIADRDFERMSESYKFETKVKDYFRHVLPLFGICRKLRDDIYHRGRETHIFFITETGPGVSRKESPFSLFEDFVWNDEVSIKNELQNNIGSLFYFVNKLILLVLESTEKFAEMLKGTFELPEPISNEFKLYVRGEEIRYINNIQDSLREYWVKPSMSENAISKDDS